MRKILTILLIMILMPISCFAASGTISVTGASTAIVGNTVQVTVKLSGKSIGSWQMVLNYDKNYLQLTKSSAEAGGNVMANSVASAINSKTYTFTFKTLKSGSTTLSVGSYAVYDYNTFDEISISTSKKSIKIMTQAELEASYSKNNNLKSISVEGFELSPEFKSDTLEYSVVVPENTKEVKLSASASDSKASINGTGTFEVNQGSNKFNIVCRAENGSEKTYTVTIEVKDNNPINVDINGENHTVVKIADYLTAPTGYSESKVNINNIEIPAFYNGVTKFTLVGLKSPSGEINLYIYENDKYEKYNQFNFGNLNVYPLAIEKSLENYEKDNIEIQKEKVECLTLTKTSRFKLINALNIETNEKGLYMYDTKDQTLIKYDDEIVKMYEEKMQTFMYTTILFGASTVLSIFAILGLLKKKKKNKKVKKEEPKKEMTPKEIKKEEKKQEIIETTKEENEEEFYDIFEDNKKKKKKKK